MRALLQRVGWAEVEFDGRIVGRIGRGLLVYVGVANDDDETDADRLAEKVASLRIFDDDAGKLNFSVQDARGGVLVVPNFTLLADASKGRRPAFSNAAAGAAAAGPYERFVGRLAELGCRVACGVFGVTMVIRSVVKGPVNVIVDTRDTSVGRSGSVISADKQTNQSGEDMDR